MVKEYTDRIKDFQIRDVIYLEDIIGKKVENRPTRFDIVKYEQCEPHEVIEFKNGRKKIQTEYCYSVGHLEWDSKEPGFEFSSVGLRWLESGADEEVIKMILDFANKKEKELLDD